MTRHDKLLAAAINNPAGLRFDDFETLLLNVTGHWIGKADLIECGIRRKAPACRCKRVYAPT